MYQTFSQLLRDVNQGIRRMETLQKGMPRVIGTECVKVVKENFRTQGYDSGVGTVPWKARSKKTNKSYDSRHTGIKGSVINSGNKLLVQTGNLRDSIRYTLTLAGKGNEVAIGSDLGLIPYAKIHNEGGTITMREKSRLFRTNNGRIVSQRAGRYKARVVKVKEHTITMPKRQYMPLPGEGANPKMMKAITRKVDFETDKVMKLFSHAK